MDIYIIWYLFTTIGLSVGGSSR